LGFQISPDFLPGNGDNDTKGKTKTFKLGGGFILKHWFADAIYSKTRGYYLENTKDFISDWEEGDTYIQFPELQYQGFSISAGYLQNENFSLRSLVSHTERQLKSTGSFMPFINIDYHIIDDQSAANSTQKSNNLEINLGPGYSYTFVFKNSLYFSLGLFASAGYMNTKLLTRQNGEEYYSYQDNFIFRWDGKSGLGYNGKKIFGGLYATLSGSEYRQENTTVVNHETRVFYHLFIGYRFKAPKFLVRQMKIVKDKMEEYSP
jgi:hypothetical protein